MKKIISFYLFLLMFMYGSDTMCMEKADKDEKSIKKTSKKSAKKSLQHAAHWFAQRLSQQTQNLQGLIPSNNNKLVRHTTGLIEDQESLKFHIMFMNGLERFGHQEIYAFAVNKKYYALLHDRTPERKKCLISFAPELENALSGESSSYNLLFDNHFLYGLSASSQSHLYGPSDSSESPLSEEIEPVEWSKDGSACAQIITYNDAKKLKLRYWFIDNGKANYCEVSHLKPLLRPSELLAACSKIRFHTNGSLYIYGWREEPVDTLWGKSTQLREYCLYQNGESFDRACGLDMGNYNIRSLFWFKSSPILLEAFLNSSLKCETDTLAIYTLEDAQIPLSCIASESSAEDDELKGLPQDIKDAIREHFTQHKKKIEK